MSIDNLDGSRSVLIWRLFIIVMAVLILHGMTGLARAERRALLIGISSYQNLVQLSNPAVDVESVAGKLSAAGYTVTKIVDPEDATRTKLLSAIDRFLHTIKKNDDVVVYYSGHGVDINGQNMLVPSDSPSSNDVSGEFSLSQALIPIRPLMVQLSDRQPAIQVWVIDACRNNPYADSGNRPFASPGGLAKFPEQTNSFVFLAASYSQTARDRLPGEADNARLGSPFSRSFAKLFDTWKDKSIVLYATEVRRAVVHLVQPDPQFPIYEDGVLDQWCFVTCQTGPQRIEIAGNTPAPGMIPRVKNDPGRILTRKNNYGLIVTQKNEHGILKSTSNLPVGSLQLTWGIVGYNQPTVFLGKDSARECKIGSVSDLYPFGCNVLQKLSMYFFSDNVSPSDGLVGATVTAATQVNVRRGLPVLSSDGAKFGCQVRQVTTGSTVKLVSTVAVQYSGDTFYWGILDGKVDSCPTTN